MREDVPDASLPGRLVLLRHAKAAAPGEGPDVARPLTPRGHDQARASARWLAGAGLVRFDLALVSAAVRTRQTFHDASAVVTARRVQVLDALYATSAAGLVALLAELPADVGSVLVVGHEPVMSSTGAALAEPADPLRPRVAAGVATATAIVLDVPPWPDLAGGTCRLRAVGPPP